MTGLPWQRGGPPGLAWQRGGPVRLPWQRGGPPGLAWQRAAPPPGLRDRPLGVERLGEGSLQHGEVGITVDAQPQAKDWKVVR